MKAPALAAVYVTLAGFSLSSPASSNELGAIDFPISCSAKAQEQFNRAVQLLHSFQYPLTTRAFRAIADREPNCAMAYWGIAISQRPNPLAGPFSPELLERGRIAIEHARAASQQTPRERRWIEALASFFEDHSLVDQMTRTRKYEAAMAKLHRSFPDDGEVTVFYALALLEAADLSDLTYSRQLKAAGLLERIEPSYPDHPGIPHYLVHSYDYPALAERGLSAALRCRSIAPASPHAVHMPSHIFALRGMWKDVILSDSEADSLIVRYSQAAGSTTPPAALPGRYHSLDFIITARLQLAQDNEARKIVDLRNSLAEFPAAFRYTGHTAYAAIPVRYAIERGAWDEAADLTVPKTPYPQAEAITWFGKALGAARSGRLQSARQALDKLGSLRSELLRRKEDYWANQIDIGQHAAKAWLALKESRLEDAVALMNRAADMDEKAPRHIAMENPLSPMRELLGELLLEAGQPAAAMREFKQSLLTNPNRFRSFNGIAIAASGIGDREMARKYYELLLDIARDTDSDRPAVAEARRILAPAP